MKNDSSGHDAYGQPCEIGDLDSDGETVGFIDETGLAWASESEANIARAVGEHCDAFNAHNLTGGALGVTPDPEAIIARHCDPGSGDACEALALIETQQAHRAAVVPFRAAAAIYN